MSFLAIAATGLAPEFLKVVDNFWDGTKALRAVYDERFAAPRQAQPSIMMSSTAPQ